MRRSGAVLAASALALLAGCGGDDKTDGPAATATRTTQVEVLPESGGGATATTSGFDARRIYERDAPGVVTVLAVTGGGGSVFGQGGRRAPRARASCSTPTARSSPTPTS